MPCASKISAYLATDAKAVDEMDTGGQFHQHFMSSFCANILMPKNYKAKL